MFSDLKTERDTVMAGFAADRNGIISLLNEALAARLACVLRYERHHFIALGLNAKRVAKEFLDHASEERNNALLIAKRIVQIGGEPEFSPDELTQPPPDYADGLGILELIRVNLVASRMIIASYRDIITYLGDQDKTTLRMIEGMLAMEEEHAVDLSRLVRELDS